MKIKRILASVLCFAMLLSCVPFIATAETEPVVYLDSVNGSDSNSGLTEEAAVATLTGAYTALKNNIGSAAKGKIVLVNDYTFVFTSEKGTRRDISTVDHSFEVVITGKTPQTALQFDLYTQCFIGMKGPTTFENVTVRIAEGSANSYLSIHGRGPLTIGSGVSTSENTSQRPSLSAGAYFASSFAKSLTVNSGDWANVYAGGYILTMTGDAVLNFNGGTCNKIATNYNGTQNGNVTININGGTVANLLTASVYSTGKVNGNVTVNINGGNVTTEIDPDGVGTLSGTSTFNVNATNGLSLLCPNTVDVNEYTGGKLTLGSATKLNITGTVTGTTPASADTAVTVGYAVLDSYTVYINSSTGSDTNNGYTESAPVKTIEQAYKQLDSIMADAPAGTSAKLILLADYDLGDVRYTFPAHDYHVVLTAKTPTIALIKGGIASPQQTCAVDLSGPMTIEHMTLTIDSTSSYNNLNACGHTVVMGEGLTCVANSRGKYFMLCAATFSTAAVESTNLTVKSGTWEHIYAGGYTGPVTGDANLVIENAVVKTAVMNSYNATTSGNVNITISNSTIPVLYGGNANKNDVGGNVTITLGENTSIPEIYAGSRDNGNVGGTVKLVIDGANIPYNTAIYGKCKTNGTIDGFEVVLKNGSLAMVPTNISKVTVDTTAGGFVSYPASMGVDSVAAGGVGQVGDTAYAPLQYAANAGANSYVTLMADATAEVKLINDLYLDMAGYDLGGQINLNGHKLYGFDSTTDAYTDTDVGYLTATITGGTPERQFKSDATRLGSIKRYLAVYDGNNYSFHRYYMAITHASIKPSTEGVGYKALFMGSDTVKAQVEGYGYSLQLGEFDPVTATSTSFVSGKTVTLRVDNYDIAGYGETSLKANAFIDFGDVIVESSAATYSMKDMVETINTSFSSISTANQQAMTAFVEKYYTVMQNWEIGNIYTPGTTVADFETENEL